MAEIILNKKYFLKKVFIHFLAQQGLSVDFIIEAKKVNPALKNIDDFLDDFFASEHLLPETLLIRAFPWKETEGGYLLWSYQNKEWVNYLNEFIFV